MTSENITRKSTKLPEENHENKNVHPTDRVHPKVTTKKTFFDIHRIRRSSMNVGISEPDGSIHPKIEWSAGSTDVGSGFQSQIDGARTILNPMVPILLPNQSFNSPNTKRPSPPVPNSWGAIDVQPTKPEEIMHLINPSQVMEKPENLRNTLGTKSRKSIVDKFLKNVAKLTSVKNLEPQTYRKEKLPEDNVQMTNPEEEFQFLNENYVREGILPENFRADFPTEKSLRISESRVENGRNHRFDIVQGHEIPTRVSEQKKKVKTQKEAEKLGTIDMPLPARRSCEPQDVKDLRRLRDSDPRPGPSRDMTSSREIGTNQTVDEFFPTSNLFVLENENDLETKNTRTDSAKELNETKKNGDRFKIENPFSDFSLQTLNRKKNAFQPNAIEMKTIPRYPDPSQPSTSKDVSSIEALRPKVSHHEIIENLERETRESSFSQFQESRKRKTSFLDKAVAIVSSKTLSSTMRKRRMNFKNVSRSSNDRDQLDNTWTLGLLIRRILGENFVWSSCVPSKFHEVHEGINEFNHFSKALRTNAVIIIVGKTFDHVPILTDNFLRFHLINYLENSFPIIIFNAIETLRICGRNIGIDYLQSMGSAELSRVGELLRTPQDQRTCSFLPSNPISNLSRQGNLVEKISRYLVHVILSEGSDDQNLFTYLNPMATLMSTVIDINGVEKSNVWESYFQSCNDRSVFIERENTLFVDFFAKFLNYHQPYRAR